MSISAKSVAGNVGWRFFERISTQGIGLVVSIILARLMEPETYGVLALVMVFTSILQVFVDSGLGVSLIQNRKPTMWIFLLFFIQTLPSVCSYIY